MSWLSQYQYPLIVFITGACVLIIEIVALRMLSPHFGATTFAVSSVLSTILAALSLGYYFGGQLADKRPERRLFYSIIFLSGVLVLGFHAGAVFLLPYLGAYLPLTYGPLVSSLLFFMLPAVLLGMLSPYAVKLQSLKSDSVGIGSVSGTIFFWSTSGSIVGSIMAGFVLIPTLGVDEIFTLTGLTLCVVGGLPLFLTRGVNQLFVFGLIVAAGTAAFASHTDEYLSPAVVFDTDGVYERITIYESEKDGRPIRVLLQDRTLSGGMFLDTDDPTDMVYDYSKYYPLYSKFTPEVEKVLFIGGGSYTVPKALLFELAEVQIDVAEIEPELFSIATEYLAVPDDPRLTNHVEDGRRFLKGTDVVYDFIFSDAYATLYSVPAHLTTREFFELVYERLAPEGIIMMNLIGDLYTEGPSLTLSEMRTFHSVFPQSYFFAVDSPEKQGAQNIIFIGHKSDEPVDLSVPVTQISADPVMRSLSQHQIDPDQYDLRQYPILTDNYAPVEHLSSAVLERIVER